MKKILLALLILLLLFAAAVYLLIPNHIRVSEKMSMPVNREALMRQLGNKQNWFSWWPEKNKDNNNLVLNGRTYEPGEPQVLSVPFRIAAGNMKVPGDITALADGVEFSEVHIDEVVPTSYNPFKRLQRYFEARKCSKEAAALLKSINEYYSRPSSLYGYDIRKEHVVDSTLLSVSKELTGYPGADKIYSLVDELKAYIKNHGAEETGFPMVNIFTKDSINYLLKVAVPVNKKLPDAGNIQYRWMLGGGNILITEVKGGYEELKNAYRQIELYIYDHKRVAPAIPFESLVTDRRLQPDSSQWITRIYYPVM